MSYKKKEIRKSRILYGQELNRFTPDYKAYGDLWFWNVADGKRWHLPFYIYLN